MGCMQEKTPLGCRKKTLFVLLINKIIFISSLSHPFLISSFDMFYNVHNVSTVAHAYNL